jgi:L-rhamnose mutarotase
MKTFGLTLDLKDDPEVIEEYKRYHRDVWPEVEEALKTIGVEAMEIYLLGRRMFMHLETADDFVPETDFPKHLQLHPQCQEWDDLMRTFQEKAPGGKPDEWWAMMERVYNLR